MFSGSLFTISDFAKLIGISRQTLIYYDRIGLFRPIKTLGNKYRLYARSQINVISLICMLSELGVPLKEIQTLVDDISPDTALEILKKQQEEVEEKLRRIRMLEKMISHRIGQITLGKEMAKTALPSFTTMMVEEDIPLYIGKEINCPVGNIADDFIIDFYATCEALGFPLIFSSGQVKSRENILAGKAEIVSHMCFTLQDPVGANAVIPKGLYAVCFVHGDYGSAWDNDSIYKSFLSFIDENHLQIIGDAYEEYLLDELTESDTKDFVVRIMIQVEA